MIITFWSHEKEETAKTSSIAAITTLFTLENNFKCLLTQTHHRNKSLESCFWKIVDVEQNKFLEGKKGVELDTGIDGLLKLLSSNKLTPESITNYTKVIFKNRLEVLFGEKVKTAEEYEIIKSSYKEIIYSANKSYDLVFVDLTKGTDDIVAQDILKISDLVVVNVSQRMDVIEEYIRIAENDPLFDKKKTLLLLGRYDKFSKYSDKNIARETGIKQIYTIPYNTLFFEACNEGLVADFLIKYRNVDENDRNYIFVSETRKIVQAVLDKINEFHRG